MSKNKTLRRLSSAALLSIAVYGTSMSSAMARQINAFENGRSMKIKQEVSSKKPEMKGIVLNKAKVSGVSGNTITVVDDKGVKTYSVLVDDKTKIFRKYGGKGSLGEIVVGHELQVVGKVSVTDPSTVTAKVVRDLSIQKFLGSFNGEVLSNADGVITIKTAKRGNVAVTIGTAKVTNRKGETLNVNDILMGHKVMASGLWDKTAMTLTETTKVIDLSLPVRTTTTTTK